MQQFLYQYHQKITMYTSRGAMIDPLDYCSFVNYCEVLLLILFCTQEFNVLVHYIKFCTMTKLAVPELVSKWG